MKYLFAFFILSFNIHAEVLPVAARLEGAGTSLGAIYKTQNNNHEYLLGASVLDIKVIGGLYQFRLNNNLKIFVGGLLLKDLNFETSYLRGLQDDNDNKYTQNLDITAISMGAEYEIINKSLFLKFNTTKSTVEFGDYSIDSEKIDLPGANLFDVETLNIGLNLEFKLEDDRKEKGLLLSSGFNQLSGRKGQSDHLLTNFTLALKYPIIESVIFKFKALRSTAVASSSKYDKESEVRDALGVDCSGISNSSKRSECEKLENNLVQYIAAHNKYGTANAIGGSAGLRSFREQRFKAQNNQVTLTELAFRLSDYLNSTLFTKDRSLDLVSFYDTGYASDEKSELMDKHLYSRGVGLNINSENNTVMLQYSEGSYDSNAWFLSVGKSF